MSDSQRRQLMTVFARLGVFFALSRGFHLGHWVTETILSLSRLVIGGFVPIDYPGASDLARV